MRHCYPLFTLGFNPFASKGVTLSILSGVVLSLLSHGVTAEPVEVSLWRHLANETEVNASLAAIARFNQRQSQWRIVPDFIPEHTYTQALTAAARADVLPCIIDIDQPLVPNFAWNDVIRPLDGLIDQSVLSTINASGKGTYRGEVYSVGQFDVSLALFTRRSLLKKISVRIPTSDHPWSKVEFMHVIRATKGLGEYDYPFDMRPHDKTEWISYAWAPLMRSWGADLINRDNYTQVDGVLNSPEAVAFGQWVQQLVHDKLMDPAPKDDAGFPDGRVAVQLNGSWALPYYDKAVGDDLLVLPLPDFGHGTVVGGGSWHWAVSRTCSNVPAAKAFITFLLSTDEMVYIANGVSPTPHVTGLFPTRREAVAQTPYYAEGGKWRMIYEFSERFAKLRPETPAYSVISSSYKKAMADILDGMPVKTALDLAVEKIETTIKRHQYYRDK